MGSLSVDSLPKGRTLALDTVILIYFLERQPIFYSTVREIFRGIEAHRFSAVISSLIFAELLVPAYKAGKPEEATRLQQVLSDFPHLEIVPISSTIAAGAARLRAGYGIRTPDAIHIATALDRGAAGFITNDRKLQRLEEELPIWTIAT